MKYRIRKNATGWYVSRSDGKGDISWGCYSTWEAARYSICMILTMVPDRG